MRVILFTQNDRLVLPECLDYFIRRLPNSILVVGAVVFDASPSGSPKKFFSNVFHTLKVFGLGFTVRYSMLFGYRKFWGRSVSEIFAGHSIELINLPPSVNDPGALKILMDYKADLFLSITANQIFKAELLSIPPIGTLNLHSSLLPKYRGLLPSFWVLKNLEEFSGVSVFFVDEGIDSGPILVQKKLRIRGLDHRTLVRLSKFLGMEALIEALELIIGEKYDVLENEQHDSSYFSFPTKNDVVTFIKNGQRFF